jgi:uncharacterized protein involved in response to NO
MNTPLLPPPLLRAPHRIAFLFGMLLALLLFAAWFAELASRLGSHPILPVVPAVMAHAFLMLYGIFPFFMTGFIFTAGPRWLGVDGPGRARYLGIPLLMATGLLLWLAGLALGSGWLLAGQLVYGCGFAGLTLTFGQLIRHSQLANRLHAWMVLCGFVLGLAGLLAGLYWLGSGNARGWLLMRDLALWGFLLPVFLTVCHRMLPFFTVSAMPSIPAWKPDWLLWAMLAGSWLHGLLSIAGVTTLPADLPFCLLLSYTGWRWQGWRTGQNRLLGMLHLAFAWLPLAFVLYSLAGLLPVSLGLAPLHAITTGFFISMVIAFVSRVSLGHAGQALQAPAWLWRLYLAVHGMALLRVATDCLPASWAAGLYALTAIACLLLLLCWSLRFVGLYLRARSDGKPG